MLNNLNKNHNKRIWSFFNFKELQNMLGIKKGIKSKLVTQGNISSQFTSNSVDIKVKDYKGLNWRFSIKKTFDELKDKGCTLKTTNNSIVLNLIKKDQKNWDQLNFKEKLIDTDPSKLDKQDPQASLMNMMKEMYQNGDEDMKRTIAQAWSKSQEEKGLQ